MSANYFEHKIIAPFESLGLTGNFWHVNIDTLIYTWAAMAVVGFLIIVGRRALKRDVSRIAIAYELVIGFFINLVQETFGEAHYRYFAFISALFLFTLFGCLIGLVPFLDESTKDLNTTFALGLTSFCYIQYQHIRIHGILGYLKEFLQPFFLMAPINVIGELAKIASMSFRLFGNIVGGGIIFSMLVEFVGTYKWAFLAYTTIALIAGFFLRKLDDELARNKWVRFFIPLAEIGSVLLFFLAWAQMFFGIFEGLIQSFVITMLTLTYLSMGAGTEQPHVESKAS